MTRRFWEKTVPRRESAAARFPLLHFQERPFQTNDDPSPPARLRLRRDGVAQSTAGLPTQVQPDAGSALIHAAIAAGKAPLKNPGQVLPGNTHAVILDDQPGIPGVNLHMPPWGVFHRVGQDLLHHQLQPLLVSEDPQVGGTQLQGYFPPDKQSGVLPGRLTEDTVQVT